MRSSANIKRLGVLSVTVLLMSGLVCCQQRSNNSKSVKLGALRVDAVKVPGLDYVTNASAPVQSGALVFSMSKTGSRSENERYWARFSREDPSELERVMEYNLDKGFFPICFIDNNRIFVGPSEKEQYFGMAHRDGTGNWSVEEPIKPPEIAGRAWPYWLPTTNSLWIVRRLLSDKTRQIIRENSVEVYRLVDDRAELQLRDDDVIALAQVFIKGSLTYAFVCSDGAIKYFDLDDEELRAFHSNPKIANPSVIEQLGKLGADAVAIAEDCLVWKVDSQYYLWDFAGQVVALETVADPEGLAQLVRSPNLPIKRIGNKSLILPYDERTVAIIDTSHQRVLFISKEQR